MSALAKVVSSTVEVIPTSFPLGAEVRCGDLRNVDEDTRRVLRQAWQDHLVLLFRGQTFVPQDLVNFAKIFGEIDRAAPDSEMPAGQKPRFDPHISVVSNVVEGGVRPRQPDAERFGGFGVHPVKGSIPPGLSLCGRRRSARS